MRTRLKHMIGFVKDSLDGCTCLYIRKFSEVGGKGLQNSIESRNLHKISYTEIELS